MSCLIVTGMHRSGTSLVMSLLQAAGLDVGQRLVPADRRNPRGFFEDADFYDFHEKALRARGQTILVTEPFVFEPSTDERDAAAQLVARREGKSLWGWKDPRTCLFLDFWAGFLPDARFLFLYRHPLDVLMSLVRRRDFHGAGLLEGIEAWCIYNQAVVRFAERHPERSLVCHSYAVIERIEEFGRLIARVLRARVRLTTAIRDATYHREELRHVPLTAEVTGISRAVHPPSAVLYDRLQELSAMPAPPPVERGHSPAELSDLLQVLGTSLVPHGRGTTRGLLLLVAAALEPETTESFYAAHARYVAEIERGIIWLQERLNAAQRSFEEQKAWASELERGKNWLQSQRESALREAADLRTWIAELDRGKTWLENEWRSWRRVAEQAQAQVGELECAKAQLESERESWQRVAEQAQAQVARLESYLADLASRRVFRLFAGAGIVPQPPNRARREP